MSLKNKDSKEKKVTYHKFISNRDLYLYRAFNREYPKESAYRRSISAAPDASFYIRILMIPSLVLVPILFYLYYLAYTGTPENPNLTVFSIVIGLFGSYIASVLVTWLIEYNNGKVRTIERLRRQGEYFSLLVEWCSWYCNIQAKALRKRSGSYALDHAIETILEYISNIDSKIGSLETDEEQDLLKIKSVEKMLSILETDNRFNWIPEIISKYRDTTETDLYSRHIISSEAGIVKKLCELIEVIYDNYLKHDYISLWTNNEKLLKSILKFSPDILFIRIQRRDYFYKDRKEEDTYDKNYR